MTIFPKKNISLQIDFENYGTWNAIVTSFTGIL